MPDQTKSTRTSKTSRPRPPSSVDEQSPSTPSTSANRAPTAFTSIPPLSQPNQSQYPPPGGKVAIPRLRRESDVYSDSAATPAISATASATTDPKPVVRACDECRRRKIKCSGDKPTCEYCEKYSRPCLYTGGKRDQLISKVDGLQGRVATLESTLMRCRQAAGEDQRRVIDHVLGQDALFEDDDPEEVIISSQPNSLSSTGARPGPYGGEHRASARVGSTKSVDKVTEDFDKDANTRATGYHGKNSDLAWMRSLKKQTSYESPAQEGGNLFANHENQYAFAGPESPSSTLVHESTYHCDDIPISVQVQVNIWALPPKAEADLLFKAFMEDVHPVLPMIGKLTFSDQYANFSNQRQNATPEWQAILNMIFAISEKRAQLIHGVPTFTDMHQIYYTRAKGLIDATEADNPYGISLKHPNIQRIQVQGLMAFYLLIISQINRSWTMNGVAVRQAISLGLNLRNEASGVTEQSKEVRYRIWWALCFTERMLTDITGRPAAVVEAECSTPAPLPYEEADIFGLNDPQQIQWLRQKSYGKHTMGSASSSSYSQTNQSPLGSTSPVAYTTPVDWEQPSPPASNASFFYNLTKLGAISSEILSRLYRPPAMNLSWHGTLSNIRNLTARLEDWCTDLPDAFNFLDETKRDQMMLRQSIILKYYYCSGIMLVNRPCLCRIDQQIPDESREARDINNHNAAQCVNAALGMLNTLPQQVNTRVIFQMFPWWCITHNIMQAMTVLMLELSIRGEHTPQIVGPIFDTAKKTLKWLHALGMGDESAARAWRICDTMLRAVAPKVGMVLEHELAGPMHGVDTVFDGQFGLFNGYSAVYSAYDQALLHNDQMTTTRFNELSAIGYQPGIRYFDSYSDSSDL